MSLNKIMHDAGLPLNEVLRLGAEFLTEKTSLREAAARTLKAAERNRRANEVAQAFDDLLGSIFGQRPRR